MRDLFLVDRPDWNHLWNSDSINVFYQGILVYEVHPDYIEEYGKELRGKHEDIQRDWIVIHFKDELMDKMDEWDELMRVCGKPTKQEIYEMENDL